MKIFSFGRRINGRFDSFKAAVRRAARFTVRWTMITGGAYALFMAGAMFYSTDTIRAEIIDTTPQKLEALKQDVIDRLQACESAGKSEDAGLIIFDSNNQASIGQLQFQIKTVQHYEKVLHGRDISRKEAILIALDTPKARALATEIIFETQGGIWNWKNCADRHDLSAEVTIIKKLTD